MIKKYLAVFLLAMPVIWAGEISAKADLDSVKVFFGGAELSHTVEVAIPAGVSDVVIDNVANNIMSNSVQVGGEGDFVILSVSNRRDYLGTDKKSDEVKALEDSLRLLNKRVVEENNNSQVYSLQLDLLKSNMNIGGESQGATIQQMNSMSDYFGKKASVLLGGISQSRSRVDTLNERIEKIKQQIEEITQNGAAVSSKIVVNVQAEKNIKAKFNVSYITYDAGWNPSYDIRAEDITSPLTMNLRANVWQKTGMLWEDAGIVLSTRSLRVSNEKPELRKWYLNFVKEMQRHVTLSAQAVRKVVSEVSMAEVPADEEAASMADYMAVNETQLAVEYKPSISYSIPSDGKEHIVSLQSYEVPAEYEYYTAPKLDDSAFLVAYVKDWGEYNLLPGTANIYYKDSFVGTSFVNPVITDEMLAFSLGRDGSVYVTRKTLKDFTEDKFFGSDVERFFGYEISVKNNKSKNIKITVEDQIPISMNEDIKVKIQETSEAKLDEESGALKWSLELEPGETTKKTFAFSVRYPGKKPIDLF